MIIPVVITDGRSEFLQRTLDSLFTNVRGLGRGVMVDDSGDLVYAGWLEAKYGQQFRFIHHVTRQGLAAGIRDGWAEALVNPLVEAIWHQEDDYVIPAKIDLESFAAVMQRTPDLAELTLKRDPYSSQEHVAGGYMQVCPSDYEDVTLLNGFTYVKHDQLFFFQPSLIPRRVVELALASDADITEPNLAELLVGHGYHFGVVGRIADEPLVTHIGSWRMAGWAP